MKVVPFAPGEVGVASVSSNAGPGPPAFLPSLGSVWLGKQFKVWDKHVKLKDGRTGRDFYKVAATRVQR